LKGFSTVEMYNKINMDLDTKLSFFGGSFLTVMMTAPLVEIGMSLVLGTIGGLAGMIGKDLYHYIKRHLNNSGK